MSKLPDKELLRPDEVATYLSVTRKSVYRWISEGRIEAVRISTKLLRIPRKKVFKFQKSIK
jgi:excisionase family DNA binding protein